MHEAVMRIVGPDFVVGAILRDDVVAKAAPLIKYMIGWRKDRVTQYCKTRSWRTEVVVELDV